MKNQLLPIFGLALCLAACGSDSGSEQATGESPAAAPVQANAPAAGGETSNQLRATIRLVLEGGEMAGTYEARCMDAGCSHGLAGENQFGLQYSEEGKGANELSSVQMIVPNVQGDTKAKEFMVTMSFGELFKGKSYTINTMSAGRGEKGSGTVEVTFQGKKATVKITGQTQQGEKVDLTVECMRIITPENMAQELGL
ncbi:hypothetical protein [Cesiribacter andamanensis]|nr:hypothetical protein [Cesiribacter andamanensis]